MAASQLIQLIIGLGNPGKEYEQTRHNAGQWFVEALLAGSSVTLTHEKKFKGATAKTDIGNTACHLFIPATYMNESGLAVAAIVKFYKIPPEAILIAHDELALPAGTARFKKGGGHAGHNGLRDIIKYIGSSDFIRLRIGIGHPGHKDHVTNHVLSRAKNNERQLIDDAIYEAIRVLPDVLSGNVEKAMNELH